MSNGGGLTFLRQLLTSGGGSDLSEVTYLTCLKTLSEAMGKLPVEVEDGDHKRLINDVARLLSVAPNPRQTAAEFSGRWNSAGIITATVMLIVPGTDGQEH